MTACYWCGEEHRVELLEYWADSHAFLLDCCCEGSHDDAVAWLRDEPKEARAWLESQGVSAKVVNWGLDGGLVGCAGIGLDFGLTLGAIRQKDAKAFVAEHHRHLGADGTHRPPCGWRWGHAVFNGPTLVAVGFVGRPVARKIDHTRVVEVTRVCVHGNIPGQLARNACSMLYGAAVREAKKRGFERVITYTLDTEAGASLRASGYTPVFKSAGGSWDRPSRRRAQAGPSAPKVRWERGCTKHARKAITAAAIAA